MLGAVAVGAASVALPPGDVADQTADWSLAAFTQGEATASIGDPVGRPDPAVEHVSTASTVAARPPTELAALRKAEDRNREQRESRVRRAAAPPAQVSGDGSAARVGQAGFARPVQGRVTSSYGSRGSGQHYGLDVANRIGTPIRAAGGGTVISAGPASGFGLWVRVRHSDGSITVYGHINRALVDVGQKVRAGEVIAEVGNRGQSTGPHLHFEALSADGEKVDPGRWLDQRGAGY